MHVAVHVIQAKGVWSIPADLARLLQEFTLPGAAVGVVAVEVGLVSRRGIVEVVAEVEGGVRRCPTSTRVFPLRLARQAVHPSTRPVFVCLLVQPFTERLRVVPAHTGYREVFPLPEARVLPVRLRVLL